MRHGETHSEGETLCVGSWGAGTEHDAPCECTGERTITIWLPRDAERAGQLGEIDDSVGGALVGVSDMGRESSEEPRGGGAEHR
jgi:hypothetical protein